MTYRMVLPKDMKGKKKITVSSINTLTFAGKD